MGHLVGTLRLIAVGLLLAVAAVAMGSPRTRPGGGGELGAAAVCRGLGSTCDKLVDQDGDGNIVEDLNRQVGTLVAYALANGITDIYLSSPTPHAYNWEGLFAYCGDATFPTDGTTANCDDATGPPTTTVMPTLHYIPDGWSKSLFYVTKTIDPLTTNIIGLITYGDASECYTNSAVNPPTARDGYGNLGAVISGGEVMVDQPETIHFIYSSYVDYTEGGSWANIAPPYLCARGLRGRINVWASDDGVAGGNQIITNSSMIGCKQDCDMTIRQELSDDAFIAGYSIGPLDFLNADNHNAHLHYFGRNTGMKSGALAGATGGGYMDIDGSVVGFRSGSTTALNSMVTMRRWGYQTFHNFHCVVLPNQSGAATSVATNCLNFESSGSIASPNGRVVIRDSTFDCAADSSALVGCVTFWGCGGSSSTSNANIFDFFNNRVTMNGVTTGAGDGGIVSKKNTVALCSGTKMPVVNVSSYSYYDGDGTATEYAYATDAGASDNNDGIIYSLDDKPITWVWDDNTALTGEGCLNLSDRAGVLPCTDDRTVWPISQNDLLFSFIRATYIGTNPADTDGCLISAKVNGTTETVSPHRIQTGISGMQDAGDDKTAAINMVCTAGQRCQVAINNNSVTGETCRNQKDITATGSLNITVQMIQMTAARGVTSPYGAGL